MYLDRIVLRPRLKFFSAVILSTHVSTCWWACFYPSWKGTCNLEHRHRNNTLPVRKQNKTKHSDFYKGFQREKDLLLCPDSLSYIMNLTNREVLIEQLWKIHYCWHLLLMELWKRKWPFVQKPDHIGQTFNAYRHEIHRTYIRTT